MVICVTADILGTQKHLIYDKTTGSYSWSTKVPDNVWVFGNVQSGKPINACSQLYNLGKIEPFFQAHEKCFSLLDKSKNSSIPWHLVLTKFQFQNAVKNLLCELVQRVEMMNEDMYCDIFLNEFKFLGTLKPAFINFTKLQGYIEEESNPTVLKTLKSFIPDKLGYTQQITYNQHSTSTGRLTVDKGPQILTLAKKYRDIIQSRFEGGQIWQIDFVSLEPRIARQLSGRPVSADIYCDILEKLFKNQLNRDQVKLAVLCALYGISESRLEKMLKGTVSAAEVIRKIKDYFCVATLMGSLRTQLREEGKIKNYYGRQLVVEKDYITRALSHYLQSTACDVALLGFEILLNMMKKSEIEVQPLFVIHDALIIDVSPNCLNKAKYLINEGIKLEELGNFPLSHEIIC